MNIASYQAMAGALDDYGDQRRRAEQMKRQLQQQAFENKLHEMSAALQKRQVDAGLANAERDFNYRAGRDQVGDTRYGEETGYRRGRDQVADTRYGEETGYRRGRDQVADTRDTRNFGYQQGRDQVGDTRYAGEKERQVGRDTTEDKFKEMQLALSMQMAKQRGNVGGYVTEEVDDEGNVISTKRRTPVRGSLPYSPATGGATRQQQGPANPDELLAAVQAGKMTKAEAKAYAQRQGWN